MFRITLGGLIAHKVRYALTALAVLLGVSFMAGTLILTDTIGRTFDGLFADIYRGTSAVVRAPEAFDESPSFTAQRPLIDAGLEQRVRQVPGVAAVRIGISGYAQLVGRDGKPIGNPGAGAPTLGQAWIDGAAMNPYQLEPGGRAPQTATEVAIDKHSADVGHLRVGEQVLVLTRASPQRYTISGIVRWGSADSPLGASITLFDRATAERVLGAPGKVDEIDVAAAPGISQQEMVHRLRTALPGHGLEIVTGAQITKEGQTTVRQALAFFDTFLLVFAVIALFVGSFLIFNTFSIVVAQRLRELALLRALGASRGQVVRSVVGESVVIGALASAAGLGAGIGLAIVLRALLGAVGIDIPATGLVVSSRTVLVCLALGTAVTVAAALSPARKAGKVAPVAALRDVEVSEETRKLRRTVSGAAVTGAGVALLFTGLFGDVGDRLELVGAGGAVTFLGVAVLGPLLSRPLCRVLGAPLRWTGVTGVLARNNAMRSPKRTASTAAALMVGVALVALMSVLAASLKASVGAVIDKAMRADFVVSSGNVQPGSPVGFSPGLHRRLAALPQVASSTGVRADTVSIAGHTSPVLAADPRYVDDLFDVGVIDGDLSRMTGSGVAISQHIAQARHLTMGAHVAVAFSRAGRQIFTVQAIFTQRDLGGDYFLPLVAAQRYFNLQLDFQVYVKLADGVTPAAGRDAIESVLTRYPTAHLLDRTQYKEQQLSQIDQLLNLVYGLLALALLIALVGIANTLGLSIHERTRELGLLRAVGMTRGAAARHGPRRSGDHRAARSGGGPARRHTARLGGRAGDVRPRRPATIRPGRAVAHRRGDSPRASGVAAAAAPGRRAARLDVLRAITTE